MTDYGRLEVIVAVRRGRDELLVVHRTAAKGGYWHLVSGGAEPGEDWEDAARRELREETGLDAAVLRPAGTFEYVREDWEPQPGMRVAVRAYVVEAPPGWEPVLEGEHDEYRWCGLEDACELLYWPEPRELLRSL